MLLLDTNIVYRWLMALPIPGPVIQRIRSEGATIVTTDRIFGEYLSNAWVV